MTLQIGIALLIAAGVALLVLAVRLLVVRARQRSDENRDLPPLIYPVHGTASGREEAAEGEQVTFNSAGPRVRLHAGMPGDSPPAPDSDVGRPPGHVSTAAPIPGPPAPAPDGEMTLQLLPGRLEPLSPAQHHEIRFVRLPGANRFTLGRTASASHDHIQLPSPTASRMHALMEFDGTHWRVSNLSRTNAVVVNGTPLNGAGDRVLADGDRVEFGELSFVFRER